MKRGDVVIAKLFGGERVERRVIAVKPRVIVICNEAEWQRAITESREPEGIGFPHDDIEPPDA